MEIKTISLEHFQAISKGENDLTTYPLHQPHLAYLKMSSELCDYGTQQYNAGAGYASAYSIM